MHVLNVIYIIRSICKFVNIILFKNIQTYSSLFNYSYIIILHYI